MATGRVVIKNKVKHPANWHSEVAWEQEAAQCATLTHTYKDQIHFKTDKESPLGAPTTTLGG